MSTLNEEIVTAVSLYMCLFITVTFCVEFYINLYKTIALFSC
jgi:hypothetical protein